MSEAHPQFTLSCGYRDLITSCLQHALSLRSPFFAMAARFRRKYWPSESIRRSVKWCKVQKGTFIQETGARSSARFKRAGGARRDTLSSRLAPQASVVKGPDKVLQMKSPSESLHRFSTKETAKMSLIWISFVDCSTRGNLFFPFLLSDSVRIVQMTQILWILKNLWYMLSLFRENVIYRVIIGIEDLSIRNLNWCNLNSESETI